jgi:hypothetical protein
MTATADIRARDWQPKLGAFGEVVKNIEDIAQCIRVICTTRYGERPLEPEFGCDIFKWLHAPIDVARVQIPLEIFRSIGRWEPRVEIEKVQTNLGTLPNAQQYAQLIIGITWKLRTNPTAPQIVVLTEADFELSRVAAQKITDTFLDEAILGTTATISNYPETYETALTT